MSQQGEGKPRHYPHGSANDGTAHQLMSQQGEGKPRPYISTYHIKIDRALQEDSLCLHIFSGTGPIPM